MSGAITVVAPDGQRRRPIDWADWEERKQTCRRKIRWGSPLKAWTAVLRMRRDGEDKGRRLGVYRCWFCQGWHVGHESGGTWEQDRVPFPAVGKKVRSDLTRRFGRLANEVLP